MSNTDGKTLDVKTTRDQCTTGNFEITCNGTLVHSKKDGQGFIDSQKKLDAVMSQILKLVVK